MREPKTRKFKTQLRVLLCTMGIACLLVLGLCAATTYSLIRSTDSFFKASRELTSFYTHADNMNQAAAAYLIDTTQASHTLYVQAQGTAQSCIDAAQPYLNPAAARRMSWLGNMLVSYDEEFQGAPATQTLDYTLFLRLNYLSDLIQGTSEQYHAILLDDMQMRNERLQTGWFIQITVSLAVVFLILIVGLFMSYYFERRISTPITQLVKNVNLVERGEFDLRPVTGASAELNILTKAFSEMAAGIQNNVKLLQYNAQLDKRLLEQEYQNLQMQNSLVQAELKNLQMQINPHFLFNTLNLISKKAFLHGEQEICELMGHTAALLRYSLDKTNKISTLREELVCIQNYFIIQQSRFEGRVVFSLKADENLPHATMPAMVLQPLVENSVMHGIKDMTAGARVSLRAHCENEKIRIFIEDNGAGISSANLEKIMERVARPVLPGEEMQPEHIGLRNVYQRLKMYYGDDMNFSIESEAECGCVVILEIPLDLE